MAAHTIDSLVLELGIDPRKFTQGQSEAVNSLRKFEEAATAGGKNIEAQGAKTQRFFTDLKRQTLELGALFLGGRGAKEFLGFITNLDASTGRLATTMNMSAKEVSVWQGAIKQIGGSEESAVGALQGMSGEMNRFLLTGQTSMLPLLNRLGVGLFDSNHRLKTAGAILLDIADAAEQAYPDMAQRVAALSMIPGMNQDMINLMLQGRAAMEGILKVQGELGATTEQSAIAAQHYQSSIANLERSAQSLGRTLLTGLAPVLTTILDILTSLFKGKIDLWGTSKEAQEQGRKTPWWKEQTPAEKSQIDKGRKMLEEQFRGTAPVPSVPRVGMTRGDRNNNPGNIEYGPFAVAHGAIGTDGRFAKFPTKEAGEQAMAALLAKNYQGLTVEQIQRKWVGYSEAGYVDSMARSTGLNPNSVPNLNDPAMVQKIMRGMARGEGSHLGPQFGAAPGAVSTTTDNSRGNSTTVTNSTQISTMNVVTQATDAQGIAQDLPQQLRRQSLITPANYGQGG